MYCWKHLGLVFCSLLFIMSGSFAAESYTSSKHIGKYPEYPDINYHALSNADLVKRGEYLAKAGDCIACHTAEGGDKPFAGGLPIATPFGTIYSPNITPDKETGIGTWTEAQFIRAMREGISPHGSFYFPVFPYPNFNKMNSDDLLAIKAYLSAVPAVHQENKNPDMPIPFRWRFLQFFWRLLFFDFEKGQFHPDARQSDQWNQGAYLVRGLGHCGMCHTPLNFLGAPKKEYALTGGFIEGFYAPNISGTNLKNTPVDTVVNVFLQDKLIGGGDVQGPMLEVNHDSLIYLSREDLDSIVTYLQTVKSKQPPKPKQSNKIDLKVGEQVFNQYCAGCHGPGHDGAPTIGNTQDWAPRIKLGLNSLYQYAMNGIDGMPPKGTCASCSLTDIQSAVNYIVSRSGGAPGVTAVAGTGAATPQLSPAEAATSLAKGKQIYDQYCAVCHNDGQLGAPKLGDQAAWDPLIAQNMDVLFEHSINGYKDMPPRGACEKCSDADIIAAVKYMVQQSKSKGDYNLWSFDFFGDEFHRLYEEIVLNKQ